MAMSKEAKELKREYHREWRKRNNEHIKEYQRKWRSENKDKEKMHRERYWEKKSEEMLNQNNKNGIEG